MKKVKQKRRSATRILAERIAERLFTDGSGRRAARLVMDYDWSTHSCGWAESCAADYIEKILQSRPKRKGGRT